MKAIPKRSPNSVEQKALNEEIGRQTRSFVDRFALELDACILWALHEGFGFGEQRLRRFYESCAKNREDLIRKYEMQDDAKFVCVYNLKKIGVDVEEWSRQLPAHLKVRVE